MMERMTGSDATMWHLERPDVSPHTLKTAVLDPSGLGRQLTLDDIYNAFEPRLGLLPRATQRVVAVPGFSARPFWVPAMNFNLADHLDEVVLPAPGGRDELDAVHGELVTKPMDHDRPLWRATLVHGLADGRQALVFRVHHSMADGIAARNMLLLLTTDDPAGSVPTAPAAPVAPVSLAELRRQLLREAPSHVAGIGPLLRDAVRNSPHVRAFRREHPDLPPTMGSRRNFVSRGASSQRLCASREPS